MEKIYENMHKYGEEMKGKFSHNPHGNGIVISVTNPFVQEIHIECDENFSDQYYRTYSLLEPQADHPEATDRVIYYNKQEKRYYRSEWKPKEPELKESEWGYIWVKTDKEYIVKHARQSEVLQAHFRIYDNIHKGQLCVFRGYAIDPNGQCKRPSTIESMFDRHKWFYNPFTFKVAPLDENTIDDFVEETPISKKMTQKMVLYHQDQDKIKLQKEKNDKEKNRKEKRAAFWNKINGHFEKYEKIYRYVVGIGILWLLSAILQLWAILAN